jgi:hypothetical protein
MNMRIIGIVTGILCLLVVLVFWMSITAVGARTHILSKDDIHRAVTSYCLERCFSGRVSFLHGWRRSVPRGRVFILSGEADAINGNVAGTTGFTTDEGMSRLFSTEYVCEIFRKDRPQFVADRWEVLTLCKCKSGGQIVVTIAKPENGRYFFLTCEIIGNQSLTWN